MGTTDPPGWTIRAVTADDIPAVRRVLVETWHDTYDAILGVEKVREVTDRWHSLARLEQQRVAARGPFLVATRDGDVFATASGSPDDGAFFIRRIYVRPGSQSGGVGAALLSALLAHAGEATTARLEVEPENTRAIAFYERHGFTRLHVHNNCGGMQAGVRALVMERPLP